MTNVNTVLGPLDTFDFGFTLMHEHVIVSSAGIPQGYPELFGEKFMERIVIELTQAKDGGIDTIVDATTLDLGRDVTVLAEASRRSGINIIATTGWWLDIPRFLHGVSADRYAQLFTRDIQEGIADTNIKAGILKGASDFSGVTPAAETILRGLARAHLQTGVPIMLHSYPAGHIGEQQLAILKEEGVDLGRVKLDHSNDTTDLEYLTWLLDKGCYLGLDRYPGLNGDSLTRTRTMKALLDLGYSNRLLLSHDHTLAEIVTTAAFPAERKRRNPYGYLYLKKVVFPQLREMGISAATMTNLCVDNPRRFFEG